jgi:hypothetical protein
MVSTSADCDPSPVSDEVAPDSFFPEAALAKLNDGRTVEETCAGPAPVPALAEEDGVGDDVVGGGERGAEAEVSVGSVPSVERFPEVVRVGWGGRSRGCREDWRDMVCLATSCSCCWIFFSTSSSRALTSTGLR